MRAIRSSCVQRSRSACVACHRIRERAVLVGRAHHRVGAIEMRVHVDQRRPELPAVQVDRPARIGRRAPLAQCARTLPCSTSRSISRRPVVAIVRPEAMRAGEQRQRNARVADPIGWRIGPDDVGEIGSHRRHALRSAFPGSARQSKFRHVAQQRDEAVDLMRSAVALPFSAVRDRRIADRAVRIEVLRDPAERMRAGGR